MFLSCLQAIVVWLSTAAVMLSNNTNSAFSLKVVNNILFLLYFVKRAAKKIIINIFVFAYNVVFGGEPNYRCARMKDWNNEQRKPSTNVS